MGNANIYAYQPAWDRKRIGLHVSFWIVFFIYNHIAFAPMPFKLTNLMTTMIFIGSHIMAVYTNFLILIPRIFDKRRYFLYALSVIGLCVVFSSFLSIMVYFWFQWILPEVWETFSRDKEMFVGTFFGSTSSVVFLTTGIRMVRHLMASDKRRRQLEKEKLETELQFLKNQLNPHFLFNALNNIYFLIKKDPELAADTLAGFSDLLRYQLYGANDKTIALSTELDFLKKYADLAQLRKKSSLDVQWEVPSSLNGQQIPPLILLPFIENAFKYVAHENGWIHMKTTLTTDQLNFCVANNIVEKDDLQNGMEEGGIGLSNVKRRLELLYSRDYQLDIQETDEQFKIDLTLPLSINPNTKAEVSQI